jgi:hypothetical protein
MPATIEAVGERLASSRRGRYGLTERLRDSPPIAPGRVTFPQDDVNPPRWLGSTAAANRSRCVLPTFALYAPFFQSSSGQPRRRRYGRRRVRPRRTDPRTVSFRFEAGSTPESRRLVYRVFAGPDHGTILDEYTALTGRPIVPPDWAFLHWRWRGELAPGTATLDGNTVNAELADDVLMYEVLGIPAGVYLFDRPVLSGNFGFARWAWDDGAAPEPDAMLQSLRDRGYRVLVWAAAGRAAAARSTTGRRRPWASVPGRSARPTAPTSVDRASSST